MIKTKNSFTEEDETEAQNLLSDMNLHSYTNESLEAIRTGLGASDGDKVLSVCGCGAQSLALLEDVGESGEVVAIDNVPRQLALAKYIAKLVGACDIKKLKELNISPKDPGYFSDPKRLNIIAKNLGRLRFKEMDLTDWPDDSETFSRGYFSNVGVNLVDYSVLFQKGALVYVVYSTLKLPDNIDKFIENRIEQWGTKFIYAYDVDIERTREACRIETENGGFYDRRSASGWRDLLWTPAVFRRI